MPGTGNEMSSFLSTGAVSAISSAAQMQGHDEEVMWESKQYLRWLKNDQGFGKLPIIFTLRMTNSFERNIDLATFRVELKVSLSMLGTKPGNCAKRN